MTTDEYISQCTYVDIKLMLARRDTTGVYSDESDAVTATNASYSADSITDQLACSELQPQCQSTCCLCTDVWRLGMRPFSTGHRSGFYASFKGIYLAVDFTDFWFVSSHLALLFIVHIYAKLKETHLFYASVYSYLQLVYLLCLRLILICWRCETIQARVT